MRENDIIMEKRVLKSTISIAQMDELTPVEQQLINKAIDMTERSYAKYSHFNVGAAVLLDNGEMIGGCNQENAAFGVTICAERTALFAAGAQYPDSAVRMIAIAARNEDGILNTPVTPCGSCRQAMIETETRYGNKLRILLYGTSCVYVIDGIGELMPLSFSDCQL